MDDSVARLKDEHSAILRQMEGIEELLLDAPPERMEGLRDRFRELEALMRRHQRFEEEWLEGAQGRSRTELSDAEREGVHLEHGEILSGLGSLEDVLISLANYPFSCRRRGMDRETIRARVGQVFRFVRGHIGREYEGWFGHGAGSSDAAGTQRA